MYGLYYLCPLHAILGTKVKIFTTHIIHPDSYLNPVTDLCLMDFLLSKMTQI